MNNCDVEELKLMAVQRFLSIPNESFEENDGANILASKKAGYDVWRWWLNCYAPESWNYLELNGVIVATHFPSRHSGEPLWVAKTREIDKVLRQKRECKKLMEALGMNKKPVSEERECPKRKWWEFWK